MEAMLIHPGHSDHKKHRFGLNCFLGAFANIVWSYLKVRGQYNNNAHFYNALWEPSPWIVHTESSQQVYDMLSEYTHLMKTISLKDMTIHT